MNRSAAMEEDPGAPSVSGASLACVINSQIATVLSMIRTNFRHGGGGGAAGRRYLHAAAAADHPLVWSLKSLRRKIFSSPRAADLNAAAYLRPFLDVVRSEETGALVTSVALYAVYKILILEDALFCGSDAIRAVVDAVTGCRYEVAAAGDPDSEETVLMRMLQVLLACLRSPLSAASLGDQHVCAVVNTCFQVILQSENKSEIIQRFSRHTMNDIIRCIFSRLPFVAVEISCVGRDHSEHDPSIGVETMNDTMEPYGISCMVEIFQFLCTLLNMEHPSSTGTDSNASDEEMPLFVLGLINSAIELGGSSIRRHKELLRLIQDELFNNLIQFGLSMRSLVLSMVCSIVLNLYHHLRAELKLQIEAFFSCVILRLAQSRREIDYPKWEVAMEFLVDFCRQKTFMREMYANFDCEISCGNVFEDLVSLLSSCAIPEDCSSSSMHVLALDGLMTVIQGMADRIDNVPSPSSRIPLEELDEYTPFWASKSDSYTDPEHWVKFVRGRKYIKRKLMQAADHFNRDPKKGLEFLQRNHLLPEKLDPLSVACFLRYTAGLDNNLVGDFLGDHDKFCVSVLHEFVGTFDFEGMNLDTALRLFLETFRLPGESQKIWRFLEAFSERYYKQSPSTLANKDAALVLAYSLIMLNTDQHSVQVKKKMTEEQFISNNSRINDGKDFPREFLSELYHSICRNEISIVPDQSVGFLEMSPSRWVNLLQKSKKTSPFIMVRDCHPFLDHDMFAAMSVPAIAAISAVFHYTEQEDVLLTCAHGFLAVAKILALYHLEDVWDDLVMSLCKFTTLLSATISGEAVIDFGDDMKARLATETVFKIANTYGDYIADGWRSILDCILRLHRLGVLPARVANDADDGLELASSDALNGKPLPSLTSASRILSIGTRKSSGIVGRFSQFFSLDTEEPRSQPTEEQLAAHQRALLTIQKCHINSIFAESKFLKPGALLMLTRALIRASGRPHEATNSPGDEDTAIFCLELLIAITLNNRDRIALFWQGVYEHIASIVQSVVMPCALVENAIFGIFRICQRLLPYKENVADELLRSLQLVLKLDARVADTYCDNITQELMRLVKANAAHIRSHMGWRTITSLLSITARHPTASGVGFEALEFIVFEGAHLSPANYILCVEALRQFVESRVGLSDRSLRAIDLMADSITCLARWSDESKDAGVDTDEKVQEGIREMWLRLAQSLKKVCLDLREDVRNNALQSLERCLTGSKGIYLSSSASWIQAFESVLFPLMDDLLETTQRHSHKELRNMEGTLMLAMKLLSKAFSQLLPDLVTPAGLSKLWLGVLVCMERFIRAKLRCKTEKLKELITELLKNILIVMMSRGILAKRGAIGGGDSLWELTWLHVNNIAPTLQSQVFSTCQEPVVATNGLAEASGASEESIMAGA